MFQPPQQSPEEIKALEIEASFTVQRFLASAVALYLSPFVIDAAWKIF